MSYLIATSRPWNEILASRLEEKTGKVFHLITSKEELTLERLQALSPRYIFFPHWSHIIPESIHSLYECVIFHMTDLPFGRGGSPLQNLILRGFKDTQISALRCITELDAGPIYLKKPLNLEGSASEIFLRAAAVIETMIEEIVHTEPKPIQQQGEPIIFRRRKPAESDLSEASIYSLNDFFDFIRMLDAEGYPNAFIEIHGYRMELSQVKMENDRLIGAFTIYAQQTIPHSKGYI
jgi:methionyl-tRNA formyltransferase